MFPAQVAPRTGLNRHIDDGVNHHFVAQRGLEGLLVCGAVGRVAAVRDKHQHFAAVLRSQPLGAQQNRVIERRRMVGMQSVQPAVNQRNLVRERGQFRNVCCKLQQAHLVLRAQHRMRKTPRRICLFRQIFPHAATGVDSQGHVQRQFRLPLEDRNLLRAPVFAHRKILARQPANNRAIAIRHIDKDIHEFHVDV